MIADIYFFYMAGNNVLFDIKKQLYNKENESGVNNNEILQSLLFSESLLFSNEMIRQGF